MDYDKLEIAINGHIKEKEISKEKFCKSIGITPQGLGKMINNQSFKVEILEKIADKLQISPSMFLTYREIYTNNGITLKSLQEHIIKLQKELRLKDELLETYHRLISERK